MKHIYKQYGALVTKWNKDSLFRARITIIFAYVLVSAIIVIIGSSILFKSLLVSLSDSVQEQVPNLADQVRIYEYAEEVLEFRVVLADIIILIVVCIVSYALTEIALRPIREARNRERRFLADAAHELRTPLSIMRTGNEVVLRGEKNLPPRVARQFTENIEEIDALTRMVNGLLTLTSKKQVVRADASVIHIADLLERLIQKFHSLGTEKGITLSLDIGHTRDVCIVRGDYDTLSRAIENVIENAIKYTPARGLVNITLTLHNVYAVIEVKDTGIGISPDDLPHVTEPFFRADVARAESDGSGLGLSIVAETVDAFSGNLLVTSEFGRGTTVTISLPTIKA